MTTADFGARRDTAERTAEAETVDPYATAESHADFYDYNPEPDQFPDAEGLVDADINCAAPANASYVFFHEDTSSGSLALGMWHAGLVDQTTDVPKSQMRTVFEGGAGAMATPPDVHDDTPGEGVSKLDDDAYGTTAAGDPFTEHFWKRNHGDGVVYEIVDRDATIRVRIMDITGREAPYPNPDRLFVSSPSRCIDVTAGGTVRPPGGPTVIIKNELPLSLDLRLLAVIGAGAAGGLASTVSDR